MKIAMIGCGYVGLVSGACFSDFGFEVCCVDSDEEKINEIKAGRMPIYEPSLDELVARNSEAGLLKFSSDLGYAVRAADVVFIAVGTPSRRGDGHADLVHVHTAAREIAKEIVSYKVIAIKSTVPVGTGDDVDETVGSIQNRELFSIVSNPEFLREGSAIEDFKRPDRIIVGAPDSRSRHVMRQLYRPLSLNQTPLIFTDRRTAELIKYATNAFLATKITFINELADFSERAGANVQDVARGIGMDQRIGSKFLHPGPGYGGSCFPKDTVALIKSAHDYNVALTVVDTVIRANELRKRAMGRKVIAACGGAVKNMTIAILGLTFKPNTDDMREAPSIAIIQCLQDAGARVRVYDPKGMKNAQQVLENVEYAADPLSCILNADAMVLVTEWEQFRALDPGVLKRRLNRPIVVDLRNVFVPQEMSRHGIKYVSIGRAESDPGEQ